MRPSHWSYRLLLTKTTGFLRVNIKTLLSFLIKFFCISFARIIAQNDNKIVFNSMPDAADNSWHLYRYMALHIEGKHLIWICESPELVRDRIERQSRRPSTKVSIVKKRSALSFYHFCTCKFVFISHSLPSYLPALRQAVIVNLWHGMPIKPIKFLNENDKGKFVPYSYVLSTSDFFTHIMADAFRLPISQVIESGLPRNDALLNSDSVAKEKLEAAFGLDFGKQLIFWLPTFRKSYIETMPVDAAVSSFLDEWDTRFWMRLSEEAVKNRQIVLVKLHPLDVLNSCKLSFGGLEAVRFVSHDQWSQLDIDLYDALSASSALITDLSSVLVDYAVTGNPVAVTCNSQKSYSRGMISGTEALLSACYQIDCEGALFDFLCDLRGVWGSHSNFSAYNTQAYDRTSACAIIMETLRLA